MRGEDQNQQAMFSYVSPEARVPKDHPLRPIKTSRPFEVVDCFMANVFGLRSFLAHL